MTLGERILQKRKECGLSQENLGQKLDVSRQTVYKWENDQAVPELNKLILLAEIFHVKVGWLIAEEENDQREQAYIEAAEQIVKIMEQSRTKASGENGAGSDVADRDRPELEIQKNKKHKRFNTTVIAGLLFIIVAGSIKFSALEQEYDDLSNRIQNYFAHTEQQIASISGNVQSALENYNDLTLNSDVKIQSCDFRNNTITFSLSAQPKTYAEEMKAFFHVNCDGKVFDMVGEEKNDKSFTASMEVPLTDWIQITVEFASQGVSESKQMMEYNGLFSSSFPFYDIIWAMGSNLNSDRTGFLDEYCEVMQFHDMTTAYDVEIIKGNNVSLPEIREVKMYLCADGKQVAAYQYDPEYSAKFQTSQDNEENSCRWLYFRRPEGLVLDPKKVYTEHLLVTDEYGRIIEYISSETGTTVKKE